MDQRRLQGSALLHSLQETLPDLRFLPRDNVALIMFAAVVRLVVGQISTARRMLTILLIGCSPHI